MDFYYEKIEHNILLLLLSDKGIASALSYIVDFKKHKQLKITPKDHSIELSNKNIMISLILNIGFEENEYKEIKHRKNLHIITFSNVIPEMIEFKKLNIKLINNLSLLFMTLALSNKKDLKQLHNLKNLNSI